MDYDIPKGYCHQYLSITISGGSPLNYKDRLFDKKQKVSHYIYSFLVLYNSPIKMFTQVF